jgi:DNA-binding transcriptional LysR family regulator
VQKSTINWDDVRLFLALAGGGSSRATANRLGISHTTVSRRVEQLEASLGTRLFDRDVNGFRLTGAGETLVTQATLAEEALIGAQRRLQGRNAELKGEIRVTAPDAVVLDLLMDELVGFVRRYPEIDLNLMLSYNAFEIARRDADIAIRTIRQGRPAPEEPPGRKLVTAASCYYASADYLERHDPWASDTNARFIGWSDSERFPHWVRDSPFPHVPAYGNLNNVMLQVSAAVAGMGIAALPCFAGDAALALRRVPGTRPYDSYDIWLLSHPEPRQTARLRMFRKFIIEVFETKEEVIRGLRPKK